VDKDLVTAVTLYQMAYENRQLSQNGVIRLAECYENGLAGLPKDKKKADALRKQKYQSNIEKTLKNLYN
jgi:TPR repeat protein